MVIITNLGYLGSYFLKKKRMVDLSIKRYSAYSCYKIWIPNWYLCKNDHGKKDWDIDHMKFEVLLPKCTEFFS